MEFGSENDNIFKIKNDLSPISNNSEKNKKIETKTQ